MLLFADGETEVCNLNDNLQRAVFSLNKIADRYNLKIFTKNSKLYIDRKYSIFVIFLLHCGNNESYNLQHYSAKGIKRVECPQLLGTTFGPPVERH
jgi:hypothetical protein